MKSRCRILLAEDNLADSLLVLEALRRRAIECELDHYLTVPDAIRAVESAGTGSNPTPDLMVVDYNLPAGNGLEILAAAAENPNLAEVPKAILSSFLQLDEMQQAKLQGAVCVISKPANMSEFISQVGECLQHLLERRCCKAAPLA